MGLAAGKPSFKSDIANGKSQWVSDMIAVENNYLAAFSQPPLSNDFNGIPTGNLTNVTARLNDVYDKWTNWAEATLFTAIENLFTNHATIVPNTMNVAGLPVVLAPSPVVSPPGLILGSGKVV